MSVTRTAISKRDVLCFGGRMLTVGKAVGLRKGLLAVGTAVGSRMGLLAKWRKLRERRGGKNSFKV